MRNTATANAAQEVAEALGRLLSDTYVLYVKTQNYHWNLVDPRFSSLHKLFEGQYEELAEAIDEIAERIRMIGYKAPGSLRGFLAHTQLEESEEEVDGDVMVDQLLSDHETVIRSLRKQVPEAQSRGDEGSADLMIQRLRAHEKAAWMLRSTRSIS